MASRTSRGSMVLMLLGSWRRRGGARRDLLSLDAKAVVPLPTRMLSDLFRSVAFELVEILERILAVEVNGSGLDWEMDGEFSVLVGGDEPDVAFVVGEFNSGPFLYRRDLRMEANLSKPSLVPALA